MLELADGTIRKGLADGVKKVENVNRMGRERAIWER